MNHADRQGADWVSAAEAEDYSATLTGNPFLYRETRLVIDLLHQGVGPDGIRSAIIDGNLFQYRSIKSIAKRVNALIARLAGVPIAVSEFVRSAPVNDARLVLLLVLAVRDRLFREFMQEAVAPVLSSHDPTLSRAAIGRFFDSKAQVSPKVASWGPSARTKLRTVYVGALAEAGIVLTQDRVVRVQRSILTPATSEYINMRFPREYQMMLRGTF